MSIKNQTRTVYEAKALARTGERIVTLEAGPFDDPPPIEVRAELETRAIETFRYAFEGEPRTVRSFNSARNVDA